MDYLSLNKTAWDNRTKIHVKSMFYDLAAFKNGRNSLNEIELTQVGDIKHKSLLHLQCHFGQDTLSWARLGADVTGVDLSTTAIEQAKKLTEELGLSAEFIAQDIYQFGQTNQKQFDRVFTSYGVLCWLPDLSLWAQTIFKALKPGGQFHLVEFHPFNDVLSGYRYFPSDEPDIETEATYTENANDELETLATWNHPISEVINALIQAGLQIEAMNEFAYSPYPCFDGLDYVAGKGYQLLHKGQPIPLVYSIKATK
ncbi:class I SAM-dependent methyltransferase [Catenovulum sp. SM1970]|uniref:class I SAM-dependent methyltransferase n=1 Tax=Marinifaba aquimaris TaxID=2741323 RepID=UPI00157432BE|nr:class I SAM-dependent methyltransferase [Marinifaba aquimaris]NTS76785.1 class I SAM-dependent methyltransferase [Marinifaba aquimaris]